MVGDRAYRITRALKAYDGALYAEKNSNGIIEIFRKSSGLHAHHIFSLTSNWASNGSPVDWGIEPIIKKIKDSDIQKRDIAGELLAQYEKNQERAQAHRKSEAEAMAKDIRVPFSRTVSDIRVANMNKRKSRRQLEGA